jgi:hypothetical protein
MLHNQLPLVPASILKTYKVNEPNDSRFTSAARLLQALWREEKGLPIGVYRTVKGKVRKLGSRLDAKSAKEGNNFLSPEIAKLAFRESVYREIGAMIEQERLWKNLLSSQPLCFNLFGGLKLDYDKANKFFRHLFPDYLESVEGIYFEHSPGRGNPAFTDDNTAFDVFVICKTVNGEIGFIAIEVKYSESMAEPLASLRPRYDELSKLIGVYNDPDNSALRTNPLQQLWREHMLSRSMIENGLYPSGRFVLIYPSQNHQCAHATSAYQSHLVSVDPKVSGFQVITLDNCIETLRVIGDKQVANALYDRYLDFERIDRKIFEAIG